MEQLACINKMEISWFFDKLMEQSEHHKVPEPAKNVGGYLQKSIGIRGVFVDSLNMGVSIYFPLVTLEI